ncbi:hypothetical protein PN466_17320 [Roseofilum reptotaenium CS-1145]|uniref:PEP-CTERM protein-sorting domain-containing protein n=1 Tax=Roseofilum reptotaenium AO1-A TaxID=1925591 RepID=A0A1L9QUX8_9CYAN|nr:hypothetical protein [Roseofilum reptotaenium]MDB9518709.1 hypothetical protein [Roseofilum reptotaenium CS-1145]OJJ26505.1 hypothetical protein BI308_05260 [Roseofilum reptotaenium AO1-A]
MKIKSVIEITAIASTISLLSFSKPVSAFTLVFDDVTAGVTHINDLEIDEKIYDVSFVGGSFLSLFGLPDSPDFKAPTFWGDDSGGLNALNAIMTALGDNTFIVDNGFVTWDAFFLPTKSCEDCPPGWTGYPWIKGLTDGNHGSSIDTISGFSADISWKTSNSVWRYAVFQESQSRSVPEPVSAIALLGGASAILLTHRKSKNK